MSRQEKAAASVASRDNGGGRSDANYPQSITENGPLSNLIDTCLERIETDDALFNEPYSQLAELDALRQEWPDMAALSDLLIAEIQEQQATTPEAWIDARLRWFGAYCRYFGYGQGAADV